MEPYYLSRSERNSILGALRLLQEQDPDHLSDAIDNILTDNQQDAALSTTEIDGLCQYLNTKGRTK